MKGWGWRERGQLEEVSFDGSYVMLCIGRMIRFREDGEDIKGGQE